MVTPCHKRGRPGLRWASLLLALLSAGFSAGSLSFSSPLSSSGSRLKWDRRSTSWSPSWHYLCSLWHPGGRSLRDFFLEGLVCFSPSSGGTPLRRSPASRSGWTTLRMVSPFPPLFFL